MINQKPVESKIKLTSITDTIDNSKSNISFKSPQSIFNNNIMNTTTTTSNTTIESNINNINIINTESNNEKSKKIYVYKRSIIKSKNQNHSIKKNQDIHKITNIPKTQRGIIHSSSSNNLKSNLNSNNNINHNYKKEDTFINIEDLLLLEDKFSDIIYALNVKSSNLSNDCFELLNFYNNSSIYNKFENYYKNDEHKMVVHKVINLIIYDIILCYNIAFDKNFLFTSKDILSIILNLNHKCYLILCDYINSKISSTALGNAWVKKLKNMLFSKLEHINLNNRDYIQFLINQNSYDNNYNEISDSIYELKFYSFNIEKYLRILLKNFSYDNLNEEFVKIFKYIDTISSDEINNFFRKKVIRVKNKNASVLGSDISQNEINNSLIRIPYLNKEIIKEFSLVLDLDETLISFKIDEKDESKGILRYRPGLDIFLSKVSKYYELIIFTAATKEYADPILDEIEINQFYFDYRLYREHTIVFNNDFVKDLSRLGRDLSKVIIVDNMPQNFRLQKENGIFIKTFWGDDIYDTALFDLGNILEKIALSFKDLRKGLIYYKDEILNKVTSNFAKKDYYL